MKRAQAAMEFLMTYGWALMVVVITLSALVYTGVFDISSFVVDRCEFSSGIYCIDSLATTDGVQLDLQNGFAIDLENISVYVEDCGPATGASSLLSTEDAVYDASCVLVTGSFKANVFVNYTNPDSGFTHTKIGKIVYGINR